jgi:hypothetical protein
MWHTCGPIFFALVAYTSIKDELKRLLLFLVSMHIRCIETKDITGRALAVNGMLQGFDLRCGIWWCRLAG